jgi:hypothetical protein
MTWDMKITRSSRVEDKIWDAVEEAVNAGWDAQRFIREAHDGWAHKLSEDAKDADKEFAKASR